MKTHSMNHNRLAAIPRSEQFIMMSQREKREYQIFIAYPSETPPESGFPVIYLLDANSVFGTMVESVRMQSRMPERTGIVPAIVVGIGYETDAPFHPNRHYDYTLPVPASELPPCPDGKGWPKQGGADPFLTFIQEELQPEIEQRYPINKNRQTFFGHSLGGLFVLHALFTKPDAFQTYIAGSPSIYWNERLLLEEEQLFLSKFAQQKDKIRLLVTIGEFESVEETDVKECTRQFSQRLSSLSKNGLHVEFEEFRNENHISVLPVLISRAIHFALNSSYYIN